MKTTGEVLRLAAEFLAQKGIVRARRDAEELLAAELNCKRIDLFLAFEQPLEEGELDGFRKKIRRRSSGEPLDYILGEKEFYGCRLLVSPSVLIPRPETEILLEKICQRATHEFSALQRGVAWDVCTGSGCLGIAFKKQFPSWDVSLSDISEAALIVARENARKNDADVRVLRGDLLAPFIEKKAHILMVNPPYISDQEYALIDREVRDFEPPEALRGGGDGLSFYRQIAQEAGDLFFPGGLLCMEIGFTQKDAILKIFTQSCWQDPSIEKDWSGLDRFFFCRRK